MNGSNKRKRSSVTPVRSNSRQQMDSNLDDDALFIDEKCAEKDETGNGRQSSNDVCHDDSDKSNSAASHALPVAQQNVVVDGEGQIASENDNSTRNENSSTAARRSITCCQCSENFADYSSFLVHVRRHLDYKPYKCSACDFQGFDNEEVRLHGSQIHADQAWKVLHRSKIDVEIKVRQMVQNSRTLSTAHGIEKMDSIMDQNLAADCDTSPDFKRIKIQNLNSTMTKSSADSSKKVFASDGCSAKIGQSTGGILSSLLRGDLVSQQTPPATENKFSRNILALPKVEDGASLMCGFCEESVPHNAASILRHLKAHARFGTYNCSLCESMCSNLTEFEFHLTQSHGTNDSSTNFSSIVDLLTRAKRFRRDETIRLVETAFGRTGNGSSSGYVNVARMKCHLCSEMVNWRRDALVSHLRSHLGSSPYICARCSSSFVDHASMHDHFAAKHLGAETDFFTFAYNFDPKADADLDCAYEKCFPALSAKLLEDLSGENRVDSVIQTVHNGLGDHRLNLFSQSGSFAPYTSPRTGLTGRQPKSRTDLTVVCALCTAKISNNLSCLIAHVKVHLDYKPLKCDYCTFKYFSMSRIRRHNSKVHPDKPVKVSYHPIPDIGKRIKEMKRRCFGCGSSSAGSTVAPANVTASVSSSANEDEDSIADEDNDESPLTDASRNSPADINSGCGSQNAHLNVSSLLRNLVKNQFPNQQLTNTASKNRSLTDNLVAFNHRPGANNNLSSNSLHQDQFSDSIVASNGQSVQKRLCRLCNTYIANSTSAFENHASRHLNYKPYSCAACSYKSYVRGKVSRHSLQVHGVRAPRGIIFKPLPGMKEKMRQVKLKCFYNPFLDQQDLVRKNTENNNSASPSNNGGDYTNQLMDVDLSGDEVDDNNSTDSFSGTGSLALPVSNGQDGLELTKSKLPCAICFEWVVDESVILKSHAAIHASSTTYMCPLCDFKDLAETRFKEHAMNVHGDMQLRAKCRIDHHLIGKIRTMCFPSHQFVNSDDENEDDDGDDDDNESSFIPESHQNPSPFTVTNNNVAKAGSSCNDFLSFAVRYSENGFKRLTCHLCYGTIADNPKSIGIHLKNHLNYKPYRCPFCTYMSCEQSKARRHVENVHNLSGDKIHIFEENDIKDKLIVVKAQCFPSLSQLSSSETRKSFINAQDSVQGHVFSCVICDEKFASDDMNNHARFHLPEAICCNHCSKIFIDKEDGELHNEVAHEDLEPSFGNVEENSASLNCIKEICFPNASSVYNHDDDHTVAALPVEKINKCGQNSIPSLSNSTLAASMIMSELRSKASLSSGVKPATYSRTISPNKTRGTNIKPPSPAHLEGRVQCRICSQWISLNPNSIDVHVKNHLEFKQHVCGYCPYRSCIIGKVKRHLDSVHKNEPMKVLSFTQTSAKLKSIVLEARSICFLLGDPSDKDYEPDVLAEMLDNTRIQLDEELTVLSEGMSASDKILARCSGPQVNAGQQKLNMEHFFSDSTSYANNSSNNKSKISTFDGHNTTSLTTPKSSSSTTNFAAATLDELQHQNNMTNFCAQFLSTSNDNDSVKVCLLNEFLDRPDDDVTDIFLDGLNPICCRLCEKSLPEHTTTMDFHARNHLTYKPFHCDLCNYKSSLEAKVKRHLHVIHNCSQADDRVVFSPTPSVLEKLHQIKVACFGNKCSTVRSNDSKVMGLVESAEKLSDVEDSMEDFRRLHEMLGEDRLGNSPVASGVVNNVPLLPCNENSTPMDDIHEKAEITCNICCESVPNDDLSKTKHMTKHVGDFEYRCQYCDFVSFVNQETVKHSAAEHPNEPPRAGRYNLSSHMASAAYERLADQCFSEEDRKNRNDNANSRIMKTFNSFGDEEENLNENADETGAAETASDEEALPVDNEEIPMCSSSKFDTFNVDGTKYVCRLCQTAVSMHSSSLYVHVKNHMNYKPYVCGYCDYRSPVKSKVRRHIINQHKTVSGSPIVHYVPRPGVDKEILRWKMKCFPETASHAAAALAVLNSGAAPTIAAASSSLSKHRPSMSLEETHREIRRNSQHIVDVASDIPSTQSHATRALSSKTLTPVAGAVTASSSASTSARTTSLSVAAASAVASSGSDRIPCLLCKMVVADNPGSKGIHAKNHLNSKPFHCAYCSYKSCLRGETKRHLNRQHPAMAMSVVFREDEVATKIELDDMIERCFLTGEPKDASSTERPNNHNRIKDPNKKKGKLEPGVNGQREEPATSIASAAPPPPSQTTAPKIEIDNNSSSSSNNNNRRKSEPQKITANSDNNINNSSTCYNLRTTRSATKKLMEFDSSD